MRTIPMSAARCFFLVMGVFRRTDVLFPGLFRLLPEFFRSLPEGSAEILPVHRRCAEKVFLLTVVDRRQADRIGIAAEAAVPEGLLVAEARLVIEMLAAAVAVPLDAGKTAVEIIAFVKRTAGGDVLRGDPVILRRHPGIS